MVCLKVPHHASIDAKKELCRRHFLHTVCRRAGKLKRVIDPGKVGKYVVRAAVSAEKATDGKLRVSLPQKAPNTP